MRTALDSVNVVDVGVDILLIRGVVGKCYLYGYALLLRRMMNDLMNERLLSTIYVADELAQSILRVEDPGLWLSLLSVYSVVDEFEMKSSIQLGELTQTV